MSRGIACLVLLAACAQAAMAGDVAIEIRDAAGNPVADAAIYAEPQGATPPAPVPVPEARAVIDQVKMEFVPREAIVRAGTFTSKLYSGREASPVSFDHVDLVVLGRNIHDSMVAWVFVVDTPWFGKSADDGAGLLRGLAPGDYRLTAAARPEISLADA